MLTCLALVLSLAASGCGSTFRPGPGGVPPLAAQDQWAQERVEAVLALYDFTDQGKEAIRRMRVYHVLGRPGWFGSTGHGNWVSIGQALPPSIVHELSHSFWGAFPLEGRPDLSWRPAPGEKLSSGLAALRKDLETFLKQPPDSYEPLRARLRVIPDLITGDYPGLYHLGEAEIVSFSGGNLNLVPPILRKYYAPWLKPGPHQSWDEAVQWLLSLPVEQRRIADAYIGIGGMGLDGYRGQVDPQARVDPAKELLILQEERRRLQDLVEQFDLYFQPIDGRPVASDSRFWRGYLREMAQLHPRHPDILAGSDRRTAQVREALEFLSRATSLPREQRAAFARQSLSSSPFLLKFAAALDHRTLAELIAPGRDEGLAPSLRAALEPDYRLYLATAWNILGAAQEQPEGAARAFDVFIQKLEGRQRKQMNFILEVFSGVDYRGTRKLLTLLSPDTALLMVKEGPAFVRFLTEPEALVNVLGFGGELTQERLIELAGLFNKHVAGLRSADEPFWDAVYRRIVTLARAPAGGPRNALEVFRTSGLLMEPFLVRFPNEAASLVSSETAFAAEVFREANPVRLPPARAIYWLAQADPKVAARLTLQYQRIGDRRAVLDALAFFAFDAPRLRRQPGLSISLEKDARFLLELANLEGEGWLRQQLASMRQRAEEQIAAGELDPAFLDAYRETLREGLNTLSPGERERLRPILSALADLPSVCAAPDCQDSSR